MPAADRTVRKPNFFIVGALKCGTTAWYEYLRSHPDIFMPDRKEPSFFTSDLPQWRRVGSEEEYLELFADAGEAKVIGEASPMYLISESAAEEIARFNPDAKILILLRAQENYLPSLHNQFLLQFDEDITDFAEAWRLSGHRPPDSIPETCVEPKLLDYANMGRFHRQVSRYLQAFSPDQVHVVWFHDWVANPVAAYLRVLEFLGLPDDGRRTFPRVNEGITYRSRGFARLMLHPTRMVRAFARAFKRLTGLGLAAQTRLVDRVMGLLSVPGYNNQLSPQLREELRRYFADDNRKLEEMLRRASMRKTSRAKA